MTRGELPEGRYGPQGRGHRSRWTRPLGTVLAALVGLLVAVLGYRNLFQTPVRGAALGFTLQDGNAITLHFQVIRQDPRRPAVCIVRARSRDGEETGRKEVYVPPAVGPTSTGPTSTGPTSTGPTSTGSAGPGPTELTVVIKTSRPPVTADVYGCSLQVPVYLRPNVREQP